jgi:hypothetical protein
MKLLALMTNQVISYLPDMIVDILVYVKVLSSQVEALC